MKEFKDGVWWDSSAREACQRLFFDIDDGKMDEEQAETSLMSGIAVHGAGAYGKTWDGMWADLTSLLSLKGYGKTLGRLLAAGIAPYEGDGFKKPALSVACGSQWAGTLECAKLLLKAGANPKLGDNHGWDFLRAALHSRNEEMGLLAVSLEGDRMGRSESDGEQRLEKALCWAIDKGSAKVVDALLRKGADPLKAVDVDAAVGGRRVVKNAFERLGWHTYLGPSEQAGLGEALVRAVSAIC